MKIEQMFDRISIFQEITQFEKKLIKENFKFYKYRKNQIIIKENDDCNKIIFVISGALRIYYYNSFGAETTRTFVFENEFCTNLISFSGQAANTENIECLEDTLAFYINREDFYMILKKSQVLTELYSKILEKFINKHLSHFKFMNTLNERQRIENFLQSPSEIRSRVKDKIIATYLGISPEYFSKIKTNYYKTQK